VIPANTTQPLLNFSPAPFRPASNTDIAIVATRMRLECRDECQAITGLDPLTCLTADKANLYVFDGRNGDPCAAVAVSPTGDNDCAALITVSTDIKTNTYVFVEAIAKFFMLLHGQYEAVHVVVDARNVPTQRLLIDCAFVFVERFERFGAERRPFCLYTSRRSPACASQSH